MIYTHKSDNIKLLMFGKLEALGNIEKIVLQKNVFKKGQNKIIGKNR